MFCIRLTDAALLSTLQAAPPLTSLGLSVCSGLTHHALDAVARLGQLQQLDLSYMAGVTDISPVLQVGGWAGVGM
jgi:hypothetical protein